MLLEFRTVTMERTLVAARAQAFNDHPCGKFQIVDGSDHGGRQRRHRLRA
jgi:hypothetical protein